eukprot:CAMPEP_0170600736 /NCGR_PEP_ID=MMETSP0224-20130122/17489_1 /TAXON_ID=285029 /ORGANISM="Togula jolla, Strain CCCM 725" /LENGTH=202 /DNA_ID=CAMNT_0010925473 /DNA_START=274 /DNA_END=883 /DNA_ORIENTATION=+
MPLQKALRPVVDTWEASLTDAFHSLQQGSRRRVALCHHLGDLLRNAGDLHQLRHPGHAELVARILRQALAFQASHLEARRHAALPALDDRRGALHDILCCMAEVSEFNRLKTMAQQPGSQGYSSLPVSTCRPLSAKKQLHSRASEGPRRSHEPLCEVLCCGECCVSMRGVSKEDHHWEVGTHCSQAALRVDLAVGSVGKVCV